jgi:c-di-GMP-binding flagellar brake protein YcgR
VIQISGDRRSKTRYSIDLSLTYRVLRHGLVTATGSGRTRDISSGGVAFRSNDIFKVGSYLELSISWPALLNDGCPVKLVVEGKVVRSDGQCTAISFKRHEFRTRGPG